MHALLLPELLSIVLSYVEPEDWLNCSFSCRSWHAHFNPKIWECVIIDPFKPAFSPQSTPNFVHGANRYGHFTHTLIFRGYIRPDLFALNFPNLQTLKVLCQYMENASHHSSVEQMWDELTNFIERTTTLENLYFSSQRNGLSIHVWNAILSAPNLKFLKLDHVVIGINGIQTFWSICEKLQGLELDDCIINDRFGPQRRQFTDMEELKIHNLFSRNDVSFQVNVMTCCPNLKAVCWRGGHISHFPLEEFLAALEQGRLQYLDSIDVSDGRVTDSQLSRVIQANIMPIKKLCLQKTNIGALTLSALARHYTSLQEMDLTECLIPSKEILKILRSCPQLFSFKAFSIHSSDIEVEERWPCSNQLSTLYVSININEENEQEACKKVFGCLSKLVSLKNLNITRYKIGTPGVGIDMMNMYFKPLQLRLEYGLSMLSTLRVLELFTFGENQTMSIEDGVWIKDNWKRLIAIRGKYHPDRQINAQIAQLFKKKLETFNLRRIKDR